MWWQKAQRSIKNNSRVQDKNQEEFKTQESRFKVQDLKNQDQDSRMKRRLNQDKY